MPEEKKNISVSITPGSIFTVVLIGLLIFLLYYLRDLVLVLLTAIVIASFVEGGVHTLKRLRFPRALAVIVIYAIVLGFFALLFYVFVPVFINEFSSLASLISVYFPNSAFLHDVSGGSLTGAKDVVSGLAHNVPFADIITNVEKFASTVSGGLVSAASVVFGGLLNLVLIVVISFYLAMQEHGIENFLRIITPKHKKAYAIDLWRRSERKIALWFQGQLLLGLIVGVLIYLGLALFGVEYALLLGILAAVFELIPFGIILAAVPAIMFGFLDGGFSLAFTVGLLYLFIQQFELHLIAPLVVRKVTGIPSLVVIISLLVGAELVGFWGVILAIPVVVVVLEYISDIEKDQADEVS